MMRLEGTQMDIRPDRIMELTWAHVPQRALTAAVDLGLFTHLAGGARTAGEVAVVVGASERGVRMILDALAGLGLVGKSDGEYRLTPESETFLVQGGERYLGSFVQHSNLLWDNYRDLTDIVRTGRPKIAVDEHDDGEEFFTKLVTQIFPGTHAQALAAAEGLGVGRKLRGLTVLDVGAGAGAWSLAMLKHDPTARAIAVDWPHVLDITRQYADRFGFADRYQYVAGNLREVDFGEGCCDLAILGHICHSEGPERSRDLFSRLHRALRPGGRLMIADMIPDEERRTELFPLLFAINMLVHTVDGDTFTLSEYRQWLTEAGYGKIETIPTPGGSPVIVAER